MVSTLPLPFPLLHGGLCSARHANPLPKQKAKKFAEATAPGPLSSC